MSGTKRVSHGLNGVSRGWRWTRGWRWLAGALVGLGALALLDLQRRTFLQLDRLETDYELVTSQSFYLGVNLRSEIRSLNTALLEYALTGDPATWEQFTREAPALGENIRRHRIQIRRFAELDLVRSEDLDRERDLLAATETAIERYLERVGKGLDPTRHGTQWDGFSGAYREVREASAEPIRLCGELVGGHYRVLEGFLGGTRQTLGRHRRLLQMTTALTVVLALGLGWAVYRGTIAPLHARLSESQALLVRQEKLASLGELAAGVAHEIRNPLTAIKFRLFSFKRTLPSDLAADEDLEIIGAEVSRLERIVRDFLQFGRPSDPSMVRYPVARLLSEVRDLVGDQMDRLDIRLRIDAPLRELEGVEVRMDPEQIKQVLLNLVRNSADSIGRRGSIRLGVRTEGVGGRAERVVIDVTDTGRGISPEVERRLFDPFFTTKEGGTGLGLSIASRIVEKHAGILRYSTELNRGTRFEIVLPLDVEHGAKFVDHRG